MHSFKVHVQLKGENDDSAVEMVRKLFVEALAQSNSQKLIRNYMNVRLGGILLPLTHMVWVDKMGKSFFLNICVSGRKNIVMSAVYRERSSLVKLCAGVVADTLVVLDRKDKVKELEMPVSLQTDVIHCFDN